MSSSFSWSSSALAFQMRTWARVLLMSAAAVASVAVIIVAYTIRHLIDWALRPMAKRIPQPGDIVVVTGASTGIGESAALYLHRRGFHVLAGVRSQNDFDRLQGLGLRPIRLDVTRPDQIADAVRTAQQHLDAHRGQVRFAALICNAGVCIPGPLEDQHDDQIRDMVQTNVLGAILAAKAFLPLLRRDQGRLVFTGSVSGYLAQPAVAIYTATKFAIRGLVLALAQELRPCGVSVSVIEPAQTSTPIFDKAQAALQQLHETPCYSGLIRLVDLYNQVLVRMVAAEPSTSTDTALYKAVTDARPALQYRTSWTAALHEWMSEFPAEIAIGQIVTTAYRAAYGLQHGWAQTES